MGLADRRRPDPQHRHRLAFDLGGQGVAGSCPERLVELGGVDALEPHFERLPGVGADGQRVTIVYRDNLPRDRGRGSGGGLAGERQPGGARG